MPLRNEILKEHRERCYTCYRPLTRCFCHAIPRIANKTHVLMLQHVKERFHAFNSARIVRHALQNAMLITDRTANLATASLPFRSSVGLLYPGSDGRLLSEVPEMDLPEQLVLLDGTWHHAKTFMKQIPALANLPKFRLSPTSPSTYRIRREPTRESLSTLEATVAALRIMEPETAGLDELTQAFDVMVEGQLQHPRETGRLRLRKRTSTIGGNTPGMLKGDLQNVVVVYGEAARGENGVRVKHRRPIYWVAQRLGDGQLFESAIQPERALDDDFLRLMDLSTDDFRLAPDEGVFRRQWELFARSDDVVVAYRESTLRLLKSTGVNCSRMMSLRGINLGLGSRTLDNVVAELGLEPPDPVHQGRPGMRLANAVSLVRYLNTTARS